MPLWYLQTVLMHFSKYLWFHFIKHKTIKDCNYYAKKSEDMNLTKQNGGKRLSLYMLFLNLYFLSEFV